MGDGFDFFDDALGVGCYLLPFFIGNEALLKPWIMGSDPRWAGVFVAFQGLDTTKREHESTSRGDEIRAGAQRPSNVAGVHQLAGCNNADAIPEATFIAHGRHTRQGFAD